MNIAELNTLKSQSPLEISTSMALRKATGRLSVFDEEGVDGTFYFQDGKLVRGAVKHLHGAEAFHEFFCWPEGGFQWEILPGVEGDGDPHSIKDLIGESLRLTQEANLVFHFLPDLNQTITRTQSQSALDDGAVPSYAGVKEFYNLIDGNTPAEVVIDASSLSRVRAMSCLAKWFSLGDVESERSNGSQPPCRLLIVDDSALMRRALQSLFLEDPRFLVVGAAQDGIEALELIESRQPDVVSLDIQMPRMDGLTALKHIMIRSPRPVVILSAFTKTTSKMTYESFRYGAVDVLAKPSQLSTRGMTDQADEIRDRIAGASRVRLEAIQRIRRVPIPGEALKSRESALKNNGKDDTVAIVCCGAGGFPSLLRFFSALPLTADLPALVACVDMSKKAVSAFVPGMAVEFGIGIHEVHPGPLDMDCCTLFSNEESYRFSRVEEGLRIDSVEDLNPRMGAFDTLLTSAAESFGHKAAVVLISGAGEDGICGIQRIRDAGGQAFVLSPEACLKPDLPRRVLERGLAQEVVSAAECARLMATLKSTPQIESPEVNELRYARL